MEMYFCDLSYHVRFEERTKEKYSTDDSEEMKETSENRTMNCKVQVLVLSSEVSFIMDLRGLWAVRSRSLMKETSCSVLLGRKVQVLVLFCPGP